MSTPNKDVMWQAILNLQNELGRLGAAAKPAGVVTVSGFSAGPTALSSLGATTIVSATPVAVAAGQKVIVWTSVDYEGGAGNGTAQRVEQQISSNVSGVLDDTHVIIESGGAVGITPNENGYPRVREFSGLAAGLHTFSVLATQGTALNPQVSAADSSIVVMVVSA